MNYILYTYFNTVYITLNVSCCKLNMQQKVLRYKRGMIVYEISNINFYIFFNFFINGLLIH